MERNETQAPTTRLLEKATLTVSLAYVYCLFCVIAHDWSMLSSLGLNFSSAPTSIADHLKSAFSWLPVTVTAFIVGTTLPLLLRDTSFAREFANHIREHDEKVLQPRYVIGTLIMIPLWFYAFGMLGLLCALTWTFPLLFHLASRAASAYVENKSTASIFGSLTGTAVCALIFITLAGATAARELITSPPDSEVQVGSSKITLHAKLVMSGEHGFLVLDENNLARIIPWHEVKSISRKEPAKSREGFVREAFSGSSQTE